MTVPRLLVLTDRRAAMSVGRDLVTTVAAAVDAGASAVVFRDKDLDADERRRLGHAVASVVSAAGAALIVASDADLARELGADGVHLATRDALPRSVPGRIVGRSCHDRQQVVTANHDRIDYVTVSPVASSSSKPGYGPPLSSRELEVLVELSDVPVLALGGVSAATIEPLLATGIHGVAVMGGVMAAPDAAAVVGDLLRSLQEGADHVR